MDLRPRIALVVGHTEKQMGAYAEPPIANYEYLFNKELAQVVSTILGLQFNTAIYLRDGHSIPETYAIVDQFDPVVSVEFHFNASTDTRARGTEVLCVEKFRDFAAAMCDEMCLALKRTGNEVRGVKVLENDGERGYVNVSAGLGYGNILIEPFFGSSTLDCILVHERFEELAIAIAQCLKRWVNLL